MSPLRIQYASCLFLNRHSLLTIPRILTPAVKSEYLVLAGNCVPSDNFSTSTIFPYLSANWKKIFLIPGSLEHSSTEGKCWQTQADLLRQKAMEFSNIHICEQSIHNEPGFTLIATPLGETSIASPDKKKTSFIADEDQEFLESSLKDEINKNQPIVVATYNQPYFKSANNFLTSTSDSCSNLFGYLPVNKKQNNKITTSWIVGATEKSLCLTIEDSTQKIVYATNSASSLNYEPAKELILQ